MKAVLFSAVAISLVFATSPASAYYRQTQDKPPQACRADGSACDVFCKNNNRAGTMYWNGTVWTDGVRSDPDIDVESQKIVASNGTGCE